MDTSKELYMKNQLFLSSAFFVTIGEKVYFSNRNCNALVILNKKTMTVENMIPFMGEELNAKGLHMKCYKEKDKIYFLPQEKGKLHVYNVTSGEQNVYEMEGTSQNLYVERNVAWHFHKVLNKIYFLPSGGNTGLWSINETGQLNKEEWWNVHADANFFVHGDMDETHCFSLKVQTRELIITDFENKVFKIYQLPDEQIFHIAYDMGNFWYITSNKNDIICWNPEMGERERYCFPTQDRDNWTGLPYVYIYAKKNDVLLISGNQKDLFILDKKKHVLKLFFQVPEFSRYDGICDRAPVLNCIEDKLIWTFQGLSGAAIIDLQTMQGEMYSNEIVINEMVKDYFDQVLIQKAPLLIENRDGWNLQKYLHYCDLSLKGQ